MTRKHLAKEGLTRHCYTCITRRHKDVLMRMFFIGVMVNGSKHGYLMSMNETDPSLWQLSDIFAKTKRFKNNVIAIWSRVFVLKEQYKLKSGRYTNLSIVYAAWIRSCPLKKKDHQLANGDNAIFFSGGKSFSSVEFKSPWSSTLRLVPLLESTDGDRDGDFDTLINVGGGVDRSPERVIIDCTSGVPDRLPFNFSVRSFAAKLLVNERAWAWQVAWNIYSSIKIWTQSEDK